MPGYTPEFPYIASHEVLGGLRRFVTSAGRRAATCHSVSGTRPQIIAVGKTADPGNFSDRSVRRAQKVRGVLKADVR